MAEQQRQEVKLQGDAFPQYLTEMLRRAKVEEITVQPGQRIFNDGADGHEAYFLIAGQVNILKRNDRGEQKTLDVLNPGAIFGEMTLLDQARRSATAQAVGECKLFIIPKAAIHQLLANVPEMGLWLLQVMTRRIRLANQKLAEMEKIQELNTRIMMGQENERRRIARDIQEGPAQQYSGYVMQVEICQQLLKKGISDQLSQELVSLKDGLNKGLKRIQNVISVLTPEAIQTQGLATILGQYVNRVKNDTGMGIQFTCGHIGDEIDFTINNTIFCLVQSCLSNIQAYSQSKNVEMELVSDGQTLTMRVADDGHGFDIEKVKQGMYRQEMENFEAIRDRVNLVGGQMRINSVEGEGTLLEITMPLQPKKT